MVARILASFWLMAILASSIHHASGLRDRSTAPSDNSLYQDECEGILPEEIEDVIYQLDLVDKVAIRSPAHLVLLLGIDSENAKTLFRNLGLTPSRGLRNLIFYQQSEEFLRRLGGIAFQLEEEETLYYVHPGMDDMKNDVFAKYLTYKLTTRARNMKIALVNIVSGLVDDQTDTNIRNRTSSEAIVGLRNLIQNSELLFANVSQYNGSIGLMQISREFTDFRYFVYHFDNNDKNCSTCDKLNVFHKFDDDKILEDNEIFSYQNSSDHFRDEFFNFINNNLSYANVDDKGFNFLLPLNQRSIRVMKCVDSKLDQNLTSNLAVVNRMIHAYFLKLERNYVSIEDLLDTLKMLDLSPLLRKTSLSNLNDFLIYMINVLIYHERINDDGIFSRIGRSFENIQFLQSDRNEKVKSFYFWQLLNNAFDIIKKNVPKSISFYEELNKLYIDAASFLSDDLRIIKLRFEDLWKQVDSQPDNVDVKREALREFKKSILGTKKRCVLIKDSKLTTEGEKLYKLQLHGIIVKYSNIPDNWYTICGGKTTYLELFARDIIIEDKRFDNEGKTLQVVAIAPKFKKIINPKIELKVADGQNKNQVPAAEGQPTKVIADTSLESAEKSGVTFIGLTNKIFSVNMRYYHSYGPGQIRREKEESSNLKNSLENPIRAFLCLVNDGSISGAKFVNLTPVVNDYSNFIKPYLIDRDESEKRLVDFYQKVVNSEDICSHLAVRPRKNSVASQKEEEEKEGQV